MSTPVVRRDALAAGVALQAEREAHERRLGYLAEHGWTLTEEGLVKDTSDSRWHKQSRILVPYYEGVSFEEGVRTAYGRQKHLEAEELARQQRRQRSDR